MSDPGVPINRPGRSPSSATSLFKKVLQAFADGDLSYSDVQSDLRRLLAAGASPRELREVLRRHELIEPLPEYALVEILRILNEAMERTPVPAPTETPASAATEKPRPATTLLTDPGAELGLPQGGDASPVEERIARHTADYKALTHAYERARDAGSAAAARLTALASELESARNTLETERSRTRALDEALALANASNEAARTVADEALRKAAEVQHEAEAAKRKAERMEAELLAERRREGDSRAGRDAAIDQLRLALDARDQQLAALRDELATRETALSARATAAAQIEADLIAERARSAALAVELADVRTALRNETQRQGATAFQEVAEAQRATDEAQRAANDAQRETERVQNELRTAHAELSLARDALVGREGSLAQVQDLLADREARLTALQREHVQVVTALEADQTEVQRLERALAGKIQAEEATRSKSEAALRKSEQYAAELRSLRAALAAQQQEHTTIVAALEARATVREAQLPEPSNPIEARTKQPAAQGSLAEVSVTELPVAELPVAELPLAEEPMPRYEVTPSAGLAFTAPPSDAHALKPRRNAGIGRAIGIGAALVMIVVAIAFIVRKGTVPIGAPIVAASALPVPGAVIHDCPTCPEMKVVPAGRFKQGSTRVDGASAAFEKPLHWVAIRRPYAISTNVITVDEFRAFVSATHRDMRGCDTYDDRWRYRPESSWENPGFAQTGSHPVTCVSWDDAKAYTRWLSTVTGHRYRLPSASEWEYAARAGAEAVQPWKLDGSDACASANVADRRAARKYPGWATVGCDDGYVFTAPVGSFKANSFGLYDMLGNVFQWTEDCWHSDYIGASVDGSARSYGDCSSRELRGGSWFTNPELVRVSYRNHFAAGYRASSVGIRVVRELSPE